MRGERMDGRRRLVPASEVAGLLAVELDDVYRLLESGELRGLRVGRDGAWRIELAEVDRFIDDRLALERRSALWRGSNLASVAALDLDPQPGA